MRLWLLPLVACTPPHEDGVFTGPVDGTDAVLGVTGAADGFTFAADGDDDGFVGELVDPTIPTRRSGRAPRERS